MLYKYFTEGNHVKKLKAFLYTAVRNATYDELKLASQNDSLPEYDIYQSKELNMDENVAINQLLDKLPYDEREIVLLHCYEGFLHKEIASMLDMPEGTVRWKYQRAISKLKLWIEGVYNDKKAN